MKSVFRLLLMYYTIMFIIQVQRNDDFHSCFLDTIGAVDGTHIEIKVPVKQQDSYLNRKMRHSINLMAICTSKKIFTYVFIGFPGSAHDSRIRYKNIDIHMIFKWISDTLCFCFIR